MTKSSRQTVQRYHDRVAHRYDDIYDDAYWRWHDALTWDYLKPHLPRDLNAKIVDLGCGTGKWAEKLIHSGYHVTCVDISQEMLEQARGKIVERHEGTKARRHGGEESHERDQSRKRKRPVDAGEPQSHPGAPGPCFATPPQRSRADFIRADLCDLSMIQGEAFACALALGDPICCASSPARAVKEIRRILTDNGVLIATFDNRLAAIEHFLEKGDPHDLERFLRDGKTNWLTKDETERFELHTFMPNEIRKLLEQSGLHVIEMIGKTVLPMRHFRRLLENSELRRTWAKIEKSLARDPAALGRASHLQVACSACAR